MTIATIYNEPPRELLVVCVEDVRPTDVVVRRHRAGEVSEVEQLPRGLVRVSYVSGQAFSFEQGSEIEIRRAMA